MFSNILIASDGSSPATEAARAAGEIAKAFSAGLTVATVAYLPRAYESDVGAEMREGYMDEWRKVLDNTVAVLNAMGVKPHSRLLREEEPAKALLEEVERGKYDLFVVGRTGAGSPGSKMMGGVSRKLAEAASCSVLIVR